jgi:hypothetical protein
MQVRCDEYFHTLVANSYHYILHFEKKKIGWQAVWLIIQKHFRQSQPCGGQQAAFLSIPAISSRLPCVKKEVDDPVL